MGFSRYTQNNVSVKMAVEQSLSRGLDKGFKVNKIETRARPSRRRGAPSKRTTAVREVIREVAGFAPYERRIIELLRLSKDRRALRFAKSRLGTHSRGIRKREEMQTALQNKAL